MAKPKATATKKEEVKATAEVDASVNEIEVNQPEEVKAAPAEPVKEVAAPKAKKVKFDVEKLASDEMISAITKFRNSASQDPTELEALANSCVK